MRKPQEGKDVRHTVLALIVVALATPAYAQFNLNPTDLHPKTEAEVQKEKERESGYRAGVSKIPDGKSKSDPWGGVRSTSPTPSQNQPRGTAK
jgi:hypothetical protein